MGSREVELRPIIVTFFIVMICQIIHPDRFHGETMIRNRTVVITGSSSDIGQAVAHQFAGQGARLLLVSDEQLFPNVTARCLELGAAQVETLILKDLGDATQRDLLVQEVHRHFKGSLDYLIMHHQLKTEPGQGKPGLRDLMATNFLSYVHLFGRFRPQLIASKGHVGIITPMASRIPLTNMSYYSGSKSALHGFFPALRQELWRRKDHVSITTVTLGLVDTNDSVYSSINARGVMDYLFTVDLDTAAMAIMKGVANRYSEMAVPLGAQILLTFNDFISCWFSM